MRRYYPGKKPTPTRSPLADPHDYTGLKPATETREEQHFVIPPDAKWYSNKHLF